MQPGDELWFYHFDKCDGCGWPREGFVVLRGCHIVDALTTGDTM